jgi:hypothetical protein
VEQILKGLLRDIIIKHISEFDIIHEKLKLKNLNGLSESCLLKTFFSEYKEVPEAKFQQGQEHQN